MIWLQRGGERTGPHDDEATRAAYLRGELPPDAMSWREGERRWMRLGARWGEPRRRRRFAGASFAIALAVLAVAGIVLPLVDPSQLALGSLPLTAIALVCTLAAVVALGVYAADGVRAGRPALPRIVFGGAALAIFVAASSLLLWVGWHTEEARGEMEDATMSLSPDGRVLTIRGFIGAAFVADFEASLAAAPSLQRIDIDSGGGFVDDALAVAEAIEKRGLRVRGTGECASACVLLWAASPSRELEVSTPIGLHDLWIDPAIPRPLSELARGLLEPRSERLLRGAGFSDALLARRSSTGPHDMAWLHAVDLRREGVEVKVVDAAGDPVPDHVLDLVRRQRAAEKDAR